MLVKVQRMGNWQHLLECSLDKETNNSFLPRHTCYLLLGCSKEHFIQGKKFERIVEVVKDLYSNIM